MLIGILEKSQEGHNVSKIKAKQISEYHINSCFDRITLFSKWQLLNLGVFTLKHIQNMLIVELITFNLDKTFILDTQII